MRKTVSGCDNVPLNTTNWVSALDNKAAAIADRNDGIQCLMKKAHRRNGAGISHAAAYNTNSATGSVFLSFLPMECIDAN